MSVECSESSRRGSLRANPQLDATWPRSYGSLGRQFLVFLRHPHGLSRHGGHGWIVKRGRDGFMFVCFCRLLFVSCYRLWMRTMHTNTSWQLSFLLDHFFSQWWCGSHFSVPGFGIMQARVFLFPSHSNCFWFWEVWEICCGQNLSTLCDCFSALDAICDTLWFISTHDYSVTDIQFRTICEYAPCGEEKQWSQPELREKHQEISKVSHRAFVRTASWRLRSMISCPVFNQAIGVDPDASKFPSSKHVCLGASMLFLLSHSFVPNRWLRERCWLRYVVASCRSSLLRVYDPCIETGTWFAWKIESFVTVNLLKFFDGSRSISNP